MSGLRIVITNERFGEREEFTNLADAEERLLRVFMTRSHWALSYEQIEVKRDRETFMSRGDYVLLHVLAKKDLPGWDGPAMEELP